MCRKRYKHNKLFGIEFDKEVYTLACANIMTYKDGKINLLKVTKSSGKILFSILTFTE